MVKKNVNKIDLILELQFIILGSFLHNINVGWLISMTEIAELQL